MTGSVPGGSLLPEEVWQALARLDAEAQEEVTSLGACLALTEQRFKVLYGHVLRQLGEIVTEDLSGEADVLADAHHAVTLLEDSLHQTSRRMLDVLDRVSRALGE